ncbi:Starch-binding associating with outer membrane [Filimonas lacunae]|uniref:Starch-binding associating with outer membrane n=1 Tax=Filimonas lacunae TaxID=477680 RepID=A0A173MES2_9BACT|nr:SusD/RagB family nutrient-binding outer membrane lipoprotein [Filimonas lacunae]BAV06103.1 hypothetical protein FLA_2118 [Filimonas lacunae]SIT24666.1 Starch-binding associating with outer membrane [Filimonas lacunae]
MKKSFIIILSLVAIASFSGCKKYLDVNTNPNNLSDASENLLLAPLEESVTNYVAGGYCAILSNYWMQNMSLNQNAPNEVTYQVYNSSFNDTWNNFYVKCMNNMYTLNKIATANGNSTYAGIAKILMAYTLGAATDVWGDVPYSQAFQGTTNATPVYDKQADIYTTLQVLLDSGIAQVTRASGLKPGSDDFFYSGDGTKWIKLAYSLKARYYIHLVKATGYSEATQAQLALTALANGMTTYADDCLFPYTGANTSSAPWYWNFYPTSTNIMASHYVDSLKARNDPRISYLLSKSENTGLYTGYVPGTGIGTQKDYSIAGNFYGDAASNGYVFNADEALFLKAEATYRLSGYAAAAPIYRNAITNNMLKYGIDTNGTAAQTYLAARGTLTAATALQRIMEEKSTANFFSLEGWTDWRRTGYPALTVISQANGAAAGITEIPRRFLYPLLELASNPQSVQSAKISDRVWWDTK